MAFTRTLQRFPLGHVNFWASTLVIFNHQAGSPKQECFYVFTSNLFHACVGTHRTRILSAQCSTLVPDATVDLENVIQWKCSSDVEKVAVQLDDPSSTRELMTIAEVRFKAFQKNLPDLGVLGHVVEPLKVTKDWFPKNYWVPMAPNMV